jgi:hypothetical protein
MTAAEYAKLGERVGRFLGKLAFHTLAGFIGASIALAVWL